MEIARLGPIRSQTRLKPATRARARAEPYRPVDEVEQAEPHAAAEPLTPLANAALAMLIEAQEKHGADHPSAAPSRDPSPTLISQTIERK